MKKFLPMFLFSLLLAGAAGLFSGCATDDPSNIDPKPWSGPQNWEGPLPSDMNQGR